MMMNSHLEKWNSFRNKVLKLVWLLPEETLLYVLVIMEKGTPGHSTNQESHTVFQ